MATPPRRPPSSHGSSCICDDCLDYRDDCECYVGARDDSDGSDGCDGYVGRPPSSHWSAGATRGSDGSDPWQLSRGDGSDGCNGSDGSDASDDNDTHHTLEGFEDPWRSRVLDGLHADVSPIWELVLETQLLYNGRLVQRPGETCQRIRFPLCCEVPRQGLHAGDCHYTVGCKSYSPLVACGPVCHNTTLRSLVQPNPTCEHGRGIFLDGALSWGTCTHHGMSGVHYHAGPDQGGDGGIWTFRPGSYPSPDDAWVALELYVTAAKVLKGGCPLRYCINATADRRALNPLWCPYAVIVAMLVPLPDVPSYVTLR